MSKRRKIKPDEMIRIAKACVKGTISLNVAAEQLGVHQSVVDDWVRLYKSEAKYILSRKVGNWQECQSEKAVSMYACGCNKKGKEGEDSAFSQSFSYCSV